MVTRIAALFPGIGYNKSMPLLYHAGKLALQQDFKVKALDFKGFPTRLKGNRDAMMQAFSVAVAQAEEQLRFIDFPVYDDVVFISKSVGTVAAAIYAAKYHVPARQLYFTPLEQTFSLVEAGNGLVFHGTADSWASTAAVTEGCETKQLTLKTIPDANHSLETGNVSADLAALSGIMEDVEQFLRQSA